MHRGYSAVDYGRVLLRAIISKISYSAKKWKKDYDNKEFDNVLQVVDVVEEFLFFRPLDLATETYILSAPQTSSFMLYFDKGNLFLYFCFISPPFLFCNFSSLSLSLSFSYLPLIYSQFSYNQYFLFQSSSSIRDK